MFAPQHRRRKTPNATQQRRRQPTPFPAKECSMTIIGRPTLIQTFLRRRVRAFVQIGRQGDAGGLEDTAYLAGDGGAGGDALNVLLERGLLEAVEIGQQIGRSTHSNTKPWRWHRSDSFFCLLHHQGQERAEHVAADGGCAVVLKRALDMLPPAKKSAGSSG
jgi:hypothetical protein